MLNHKSTRVLSDVENGNLDVDILTTRSERTLELVWDTVIKWLEYTL